LRPALLGRPKNRVAQKKTVRAKVSGGGHSGRTGGGSKTTGVEFVKRVGFKLGVKERGSYG